MLVCCVDLCCVWSTYSADLYLVRCLVFTCGVCWLLLRSLVFIAMICIDFYLWILNCANRSWLVLVRAHLTCELIVIMCHKIGQMHMTPCDAMHQERVIMSADNGCMFVACMSLVGPISSQRNGQHDLVGMTIMNRSWCGVQPDRSYVVWSSS